MHAPLTSIREMHCHFLLGIVGTGTDNHSGSKILCVSNQKSHTTENVYRNATSVTNPERTAETEWHNHAIRHTHDILNQTQVSPGREGQWRKWARGVGMADPELCI